MKNIKQIKDLVLNISANDNAVLMDHDLNVTVLDSSLRLELNSLIKNMTFNELNRVVGYLIEELEGDGIDMNDVEMDDPDLYMSFCLNECDQTLEDVQAYINEFKINNIE